MVEWCSNPESKNRLTNYLTWGFAGLRHCLDLDLSYLLCFFRPMTSPGVVEDDENVKKYIVFHTVRKLFITFFSVDILYKAFLLEC